MIKIFPEENLINKYRKIKRNTINKQNQGKKKKIFKEKKKLNIKFLLN